MKIKKVNLGMLVLLGFLVVNLPSSVYGSGGHEESDERASTLDFGDETMLSPVWHKILKTQKELSEAVESGKLASVHKFAFEIRDLSKELLKRSTDEDLSEEKMSQMKATVGRVAEVAVFLDKYGDGGDQANTEKYLVKMDNLINYIDMLYAEEDKLEHHDKEESDHDGGGDHHDD